MNVFDFGSLSITEQKKILVPKSRAKLFFESDVSDQGAFAYGDVVKFILRIPRKMGTSWVRMILSGDAHKNPNDDSSEEVLYREIPMTWTSFKFDVDCDIYETEINMADIVGEKKCGLFYYAYKAHTAGGITELRDGYNMFQLLVYE